MINFNVSPTVDIESGDEIIIPCYTFSSTANAAALVGAKLVFVDVRGLMVIEDAEEYTTKATVSAVAF